eukprot:scaffold22267_cov159-Skeletonema_dohrnii-CCMP3373.AAC.4
MHTPSHHDGGDIVRFVLSSFTALLLHPILPSTKASLTITQLSSISHPLTSPWPLGPEEHPPGMLNRGVCPTVLDGESITTAAFLRRSLYERFTEG